MERMRALYGANFEIGIIGVFLIWALRLSVMILRVVHEETRRRRCGGCCVGNFLIISRLFFFIYYYTNHPKGETKEIKVSV